MESYGPRAGGWLSGRRFLVVDDCEALADNVAEILRELGAEVVVAYDGAAALACTCAQSFDVVITDEQMPRMRGSELVRELRSLGLQTPVLLVSSELDRVLIGSEPGVVAEAKPLSPYRLVELVCALAVR